MLTIDCCKLSEAISIRSKVCAIYNLISIIVFFFNNFMQNLFRYDVCEGCFVLVCPDWCHSRCFDWRVTLNLQSHAFLISIFCVCLHNHFIDFMNRDNILYLEYKFFPFVFRFCCS